MNIASLLASKGPRVVTIRPEQTIRQALALLAEHNIGALVVAMVAVTVANQIAFVLVVSFARSESIRRVLGGLGPIDVLDFDMCLMGGYETLVKVNGLASHAVFSEEVVPGAGNPYDGILNALQANPTASPSAVADMFVEQFHASYTGDPASTTKSAYDLAGFGAFEAALKENKIQHEMHMYPGTQHGFNNDTTPRYDEAAAKLAWQRTLDFFNKHVRG